MAKQIKTGAILPAETFFYTIPFAEGKQQLTKDMLNRNYGPLPTEKKGYSGVQTNYISYINRVVTLSVIQYDQSEFILHLHVGVNELHIACSCGMSDQKLCYHSYIGLNSQMSFDNKMDFGQYYWPGFEEDEKKQTKFLIIEISKTRIIVEPKQRYGNIFKPEKGFRNSKLPSLNEQTIKHGGSVTGKNSVIAYCLAYTFSGFSSSHLPVLIPCLGVTSNDDTRVVSFKRFISSDDTIEDLHMSANEQLLNEICFDLYELAKKYDDLSKEEDRPVELAKIKIKQALFELWQKALPLLIVVNFNYAFYAYWLKYLKNKPRKSDMMRCTYSLDRPVLSFILRFNQDHFSLESVITVSGRKIKPSYKPNLFLLERSTGQVYLMGSVQDDDLLNWFLDCNSRLTILKEHFTEFNDKFLDQLSRHYDVKYVNSNVKARYDFNHVISACV